jgi:hypothetical protein
LVELLHKIWQQQSSAEYLRSSATCTGEASIYVVWETAAKFGLQVDNIKYNTQDEE